MDTISFSGNYDNLELISDTVAQAARSAGMDENNVYAVQLAFVEACSNIIEHAYGGEGRGEILLTMRSTEDALILMLQDFGQPFDPGDVPEPRLDGPLEDLEDQGLGLYWMRKLMDEVRFDFPAEGGTILTMTKRIEQAK